MNILFSLISSFLFALSANADNFVVGLSYGVKKIEIGIKSNLIISIITMLGTIISMWLSKIIVGYIPMGFANMIGGIMLILIGGWTIVEPLVKSIRPPVGILKNPDKADRDKSSHIDSKEAVTLAFALSINNIGLGIGASITGLNIFLTGGFTFIFSIIMIVFGYFVGSYYLSTIFNKKATIISGIIIMALGIFEIFV